MNIYSYSLLDEKVFHYKKLTEGEVARFADRVNTEIFFVLSDEEADAIAGAQPVDNLKEDFIYYHATINGTSWWQCTCGNFLETDSKGVDRMLKKTVAHARKTGHIINPRGN